MSSTVTVACSHPSGLILELGLELDYAQSRFIRTPAYKVMRLNGAYRAMIAALPKGASVVATRDLSPGLTEVPEDFAREWFRRHPHYAANGIAWIVEAPKDLKHQVADKPPSAFQPLDPTGDVRISTTVARADFTSTTGA